MPSPFHRCIPQGAAGFLLAGALALLGMTGCDKEPPPDLHVRRGYELLPRDPRAAYEEFRKARSADEPLVLLGGGLALEQLRRFEEAEPVLARATDKTEGPSNQVARLAWVRVRIALGDLEGARSALAPLTHEAEPELTALFIDSLLAHDERRARLALTRWNAWQKRAMDQQARQAKVPAEFYFAQMMLTRQLGLPKEFAKAAQRATLAKLREPEQTLPLVQLALQTERRDMALALLRKLHDHGASEKVRRSIARLALELGDLQLAGEVLKSLSGDDFQVVSLRAEYEFRTGSREAVGTLRRALAVAEATETRRKLVRWLVEALLRQGQLQEARSEAEKLFQKDPGEAAVLLLARLDLAEGQPDAAVDRLLPWLQKEHPSLELRQWAARAHLGSGNGPAARPLFDSVLDQSPQLTPIARLRIALEFVEGQPEAAVEVAQRLVERAPDNPELRILLAEALHRVSGPDAALASLRHGVAARKGDVRLRMALVQALRRRKDGAAVLAELEKAHRELPREPIFAAALASELGRMGQAERAATLYETLLDTAEGDAVALNNLAMIYADELDQPERAVELAERAHRLSQIPPVVDTLGWALYRRGRPDDLKRARKLLESVQSEFTDPSFQVHLGSVLLSTGAPEEGRRLLRRALASEDDFAEAELARELLREAP